MQGDNAGALAGCGYALRALRTPVLVLGEREQTGTR